MKECPLIDTCEIEIIERHFKVFCRNMEPSSLTGYKNCPIYIAKREHYKPREWKKKKEG